MIIVTGGAGFIGSNLVKTLNHRGVSDILVVDNLSNAEKIHNLSDLDIIDYMDKHEFLSAVEANKSIGPVSAILHQGACSDTMATDGKYVLENNFTYSKKLYRYCASHKVQYIYASSASVYGAGKVFDEEPKNESALNAYAWSKLLFDQFVRRQPAAEFQCVGLRYFNVYGSREQHKGRMASVAWHFYNQYLENGQVQLFEGSDGYAHGEQQRDFVSVEDVIRINLYLMDNQTISGIYNAGTGQAQSFNDVATAVINTCRHYQGKGRTTLEQAQGDGEITYVPMPQALHGKYQSYTRASLENLRAVGYREEFYDVEKGVGKYINELLSAQR